MRTLIIVLPAILLLANEIPTAHAELAPDSREDADIVLTGKVLKIFQRREGRLREYVFWIHVREVHRGTGVKAGEIFYAFCFQRTPALFPQPEPSGHDKVPKEGQRIKAYIHHRKGVNTGNYPNWFDVVPPPEAPARRE